MEHDVCSIVAHIEVIQLVAVKAKVFFEAADVGIADICLVCCF